MNLNRRDFLRGSILAGAGVATMGALAACSPQTTSAEARAGEVEEASQATTPENIAETLECDVVIVGGGLSGLAAAVQAGESGLNAIVLEAGTAVGGNGNGVEGIFGCNTSGQKEQGIEELDPGAIVRHELEAAQHLPDGVIWTDLVKASVENYDWLKEQGVEFSGVINDYGGLYPTMHWFGGNKAAVGYVPPMEAKAKELGAKIMTDTPGTGLVFDGETVGGVYAKNKEGEDIQVNAKAVVLATGGYGYNDEYLERWGYNMEHLQKIGNPLNKADGINMALAVGAQDCIDDACFLAAPNIDGLSGKGSASGKLCFGGPFLWVNKDGQRFVNEDLAAGNVMSAAMPSIAQREMYCLADSAIIEAALDGEENVTASGNMDARAEFEKVLTECPSDNIYQGDSIEELAGKFGIDPASLAATVDRYNSLCEAGHDSDFGKDASAMAPIVAPPFYLYRLDPAVMVAIGGLGTNRNMQVVNEEGEAIAGLYAIGTDGVRLYRRIYSIQIGATCCGNNVNSGRIAIKHIAANLK